MCGIAGFTRFHQPIGDEALLKKMGEAIRHRGPDAEGTFLAEHVGLHHRRLSIIDLSDAGTQPMHSHCGQYTIVFNGEIYNFLELREVLEVEGYPFRSHTDTEVILALYAKSGRDCLAELNGMFAFALWDRESESLFLARDRVGKKPLYYTFIDGDIAFASELKALLAADLIEREVRLDAVYDFFAYQYVPDPKTIFDNVFKLEPGHSLLVDKSATQKQQYWDVSFGQQTTDESSATAQLAEHIKSATARRMIADVPLGAFLSGGVDSSGIVATMAKHSDRTVTTCSIGFDEERFDETEFAARVATLYQTDHHEFTVSEDIAASLEAIASYFDEPFADPSLVPTYFVSKLARNKVTVALAGDGGDEVFAGYEKYSTDELENRWRQRIPDAIRRAVFPPIAATLAYAPLRILRRAGSLLRALSQEPAMAFYQSNAQITDAQWKSLCQPETYDALADYHPSEQSIAAYEHCDGADHLSRILYTDIKTYLPGDILVKVDRMSMAHSLEVRAPLLDFKLMEFASGCSSALKLRTGEKKYLLRRVFREDLPQKILDRKKMGFTPPVAEWLRGELKPLAERTILECSDGICRYFEVDAVRALWEQHQHKRRDNSAILWSLLMFQLWWNDYGPNET